MVEKQKTAILKKILGSYRQNGDEYLFFCPFCKHHKRKLSLNLQKNAWKCWVCDAAGKKIFQLVRKFGGLSDVKEWIKHDKTVDISKCDEELSNLFSEERKSAVKLELPAEFVSLASKNLSSGALPALAYLKSREITQKDILYWKIGHCLYGEYEGRVIIPSFDMDGDVNFFVARSYRNHYLKYKNPKVPKNEIIFNHLFIDFSSPVFITEGVFDAIRLGQNAIPVLGSTLHRHSALFKEIVLNKTPVYLALDADATKKESNIIKNLLQFGIEVRKIDTEGYQDIAEMPQHEIGKRIKEASHITAETLFMKQILQAV